MEQYLQLLIACVHGHDGNKDVFRSNDGVEAVLSRCMPYAADHPDATCYALELLAEVRRRGVAGWISGFGVAERGGV